MRSVSLLLSGLLISFVLGGLPSTISLAGGPRRCDHKGVSSVDVEKVRPVARRTAAGHRLDWSTLEGCTNSNGAWAHIDIVNEPQPDGSLIHGAAWCNRGRGGPWECDYASGRAYRMSVVVVGATRELDTNIPDPFAVDAASKLMQQAIDIAPRLTVEHICGFQSDSAPDDNDARAVERIHRDFRFEDPGAYARITRESDGSLSVSAVVDYYLSFVHETAGGDTIKFNCWGFAIVV